ncbi:YitT family protein [Paenibacillus sp. KQZ6P-2]|uniref:YitT family protein n=1 Tax=Paenibacillus mangrovi TaxID=2931978 RepID=A0A9X1WT33_9BACL|nr:YitT family protein [Paenibacillus mangrovi]MCJ8014757.1 YitT family protein [Paenibacillus mangrovi]
MNFGKYPTFIEKPIKASMKPAQEIGTILVSAFLVAAGLNLFLVPHHLLSGGIAGVASIIGYLTDWNISFLYFILNVPLIIWGWKAVGKRYILLSCLSVVSTTWFMSIIPVVQVTKDPILAAIFGGIISAIGIGFSLRVGGSTGGFDIVGSIVTYKHDFAMGNILLILNGIVIMMLGFYKSWDLALYSMLSTYIKGKIVDNIHVDHVKVTCFIVTKKKDEMLCQLRKLHHGITCLHSEGGYSEEDNYMLMTVTTRYEVPAVRKTVMSTDPHAFMNVVQSTEILGRFTRPRR